jgi:hypothetical protein
MDFQETNTWLYAHGKGLLRAIAATAPDWAFARA